MRINSLKTLDLILSLSKDEAKLSGFFGSPLEVFAHPGMILWHLREAALPSHAEASGHASNMVLSMPVARTVPKCRCYRAVTEPLSTD
jgi:hypothetical protein